MFAMKALDAHTQQLIAVEVGQVREFYKDFPANVQLFQSSPRTVVVMLQREQQSPLHNAASRNVRLLAGLPEASQSRLITVRLEAAFPSDYPLRGVQWTTLPPMPSENVLRSDLTRELTAALEATQSHPSEPDGLPARDGSGGEGAGVKDVPPGARPVSLASLAAPPSSSFCVELVKFVRWWFAIELDARCCEDSCQSSPASTPPQGSHGAGGGGRSASHTGGNGGGGVSQVGGSSAGSNGSTSRAAARAEAFLRSDSTTSQVASPSTSPPISLLPPHQQRRRGMPAHSSQARSGQPRPRRHTGALFMPDGAVCVWGVGRPGVQAPTHHFIPADGSGEAAGLAGVLGADHDVGARAHATTSWSYTSSFHSSQVRGGGGGTAMSSAIGARRSSSGVAEARGEHPRAPERGGVAFLDKSRRSASARGRPSVITGGAESEASGSESASSIGGDQQRVQRGRVSCLDRSSKRAFFTIVREGPFQSAGHSHVMHNRLDIASIDAARWASELPALRTVSPVGAASARAPAEASSNHDVRTPAGHPEDSPDSRQRQRQWQQLSSASGNPRIALVDADDDRDVPFASAMRSQSHAETHKLLRHHHRSHRRLARLPSLLMGGIFKRRTLRDIRLGSDDEVISLRYNAFLCREERMPHSKAAAHIIMSIASLLEPLRCGHSALTVRLLAPQFNAAASALIKLGLPFWAGVACCSVALPTLMGMAPDSKPSTAAAVVGAHSVQGIAGIVHRIDAAALLPCVTLVARVFDIVGDMVRALEARGMLAALEHAVGGSGGAGSDNVGVTLARHLASSATAVFGGTQAHAALRPEVPAVSLTFDSGAVLHHAALSPNAQPQCSVCLEPIAALHCGAELVVCCWRCGHGGHASHMAAWFEQHHECPTGCGCECVF